VYRAESYEYRVKSRRNRKLSCTYRSKSDAIGRYRIKEEKPRYAAPPDRADAATPAVDPYARWHPTFARTVRQRDRTHATSSSAVIAQPIRGASAMGKRW